MNNLITRRIAAFWISTMIFSGVAFSQFDEVNFLKGTASDATKLLEAYVSPWINAFGAGLNGGWYNTAKPHKFGGFDITTSVNVGIVPVSDQTFDLSSLNFQNFEPKTGTAPTIAGPDEGRPTMTYSVSGITLASFTTPPGTNWRFIPVPTAQLGIGLPLGTEIKGRFIPKIPIQDGDIMLWGVGLVHSIMQYIPGNELLPVDVSLFGGYTKLKANAPVNLQPETMTDYVIYNTSSFSDQNLAIAVQAFNVSAIASVNVAVLTVYGGLGYTKTSTVMNMSGNYPTPLFDGTNVVYNDSGVRKGEDFGEMNVENFSGLRANIGFRLKLAVITFHADYTRAQYNVVSGGIGVSFR